MKIAGADSWYQIDLPDDVKYFTFQRMHLVRLYGGSFVSTFPEISPERWNNHGIDNFAFPNLEYNPHIPTIPGAPGLIFASCDPDIREVYRIFTPWKGDSTWGYMGDYEFIPTPSLTAAEYNFQEQRVGLFQILSEHLTSLIANTT